jgi:hypothetical protein
MGGVQRQRPSPIDLAYSDDNGASWTGPIRISDQGHQFDQDVTPVAGPDGTVYVSWINGPNEKSLIDNVAMIAKSTDGGNTWSADQVVAPIPVPVGYGTGLPNSHYRTQSGVRSVVDQRTGTIILTFNERLSGASQMWSTHTLAPGDVTHWSAPTRVEPTGPAAVLPLAVGCAGRTYRPRLLRPELRPDRRQAQLRDARLDAGRRRVVDDGEPARARFRRRQVLGVPRARRRAGLRARVPRRLHRVASNDQKAQALWTGNGSQGWTFSPAGRRFRRRRSQPLLVRGREGPTIERRIASGHSTSA